MYIETIMMWEGINQRKFPRVNYKCLIKVSREDSEEVIDTYTENIGGGGICVVLDKDFGLFTSVDLELYIDDDRAPVTCTGSIVWVVKKHPATDSEPVTYDTGIEFSDLGEEDRSRIEGLVQRLLQSKT
ncbi:MAG: hypothetical protein GF408_02225 [Candidatus Omnitrophica bacterium]|nr:hypothetical protein [Candidatus Omnitrophota bacterium]